MLMRGLAQRMISIDGWRDRVKGSHAVGMPSWGHGRNANSCGKIKKKKEELYTNVLHLQSWWE